MFAATLGLIPCPTLATVTGFTLLACGLRSRAWTATLAVVAACYALFGALRLGVHMDLALLVGDALPKAVLSWLR